MGYLISILIVDMNVHVTQVPYVVSILDCIVPKIFGREFVYELLVDSSDLFTAGEIVTDTDEVLTSDRVKVVEDVGGKQKSKAKVTRSIVFVTAEAAPYSKTGGLGDVCGSLPVVLAGRGHRVMVVSPRYLHGSPADKNFSGVIDVGHINVFCFGAEQEVAFFHEYREGVDWVRY